MDIRTIRLVLALAEHRHFARAAEANSISQSAFSARLQSLEFELGVRLVERGARFERFTETGERLLPRLRDIVGQIDALRQETGGDAAALAGHLRIAVIPTQLAVAGAMAADVRALHPLVHVTIQSRSSKAIDAALDQYEADVGISYSDGQRPDRFFATRLASECYALVVSRNDRSPSINGTISWAEAARLPLALLTPDMQNRRILDDAFASAGAAPSVMIESDTFTAILGAVRTGVVATILPAVQADQLAAGADITVLRLVSPTLERGIALYALKRDPQLPVISAVFAAIQAI